MTSLRTKLQLNDGKTIPQFGLGLWQVPADTTARVAAEALGLGYRLLDGASIYGNEEGLGEGLRRSGVARDDVFVTTKVWNDAQGYDATLRAVDESLARLQFDWLDLCLIHWPVAQKDLYVPTWKALIRLREEGRIGSIGVSNFNAIHLERLIGETGVVPAVNQIEIHPRLQQAELRDKNAELGILTQSWSPLGQGRSFDHPTIRTIAARLGVTPAQVILRWHIELGLSVIPRSSQPQRLAENASIFDFSLAPEDLRQIEALDCQERTGPDPLQFGVS